MPAHVSVATAIEKNRIASATAFVLCLDVEILDPNNNWAYVQTLSICKNTENLIYNDTIYTAANFNVEMQLDTQNDPEFQIIAQDPTGYIRQVLEQYGGGVGSQVTLTVVNSGNLDQPPEIQMAFEITGAAANGWVVTWTLGIENPLAQRFPYRLEWQDQCPYPYKGPRCKYSGPLTTCDFTYFGSNGCQVHNNTANFGGFLGLTNIDLGS